jgi:hypothetical protein
VSELALGSNLLKYRSPEVPEWALTATSLHKFVHLGGFGPEKKKSVEVSKF